MDFEYEFNGFHVFFPDENARYVDAESGLEISLLFRTAWKLRRHVLHLMFRTAWKHCQAMFSTVSHRYAATPGDIAPDKVDFRS